MANRHAPPHERQAAQWTSAAGGLRVERIAKTGRLACGNQARVYRLQGRERSWLVFDSEVGGDSPGYRITIRFGTLGLQ